MKIENQCCNESQSRALQNLGIKYKDYQFAFVDFGVPSGQETVFCRQATETEQFHKEWAWFLIGKHSKQIREEIDEGTLGADGGVYPAFTVAELGCMLPDKYLNTASLHTDDHLKTKQYYYGFWKTGNEWSYRLEGYEPYPTEFFKTQAECYADFLIHLLENNLITAEEVNQRLANS